MKRFARFLLLINFISILLLTGCASGGNQTAGEVTISIRCDTAIANGLQKEARFEGVLPEDGCILAETTVPYAEGDSVFDILQKVTDENKIAMEFNGNHKNAYIEGIGHLYEFDGGRWSGWMFSVNGEYPDRGCGECKVSDGDKIEWNYTCDLGVDLDAAMENALEWKETHQ